MSLTRRELLAAAGCGLAALAASGADDKKPAADEDVLKPFIAHLARNGIKLERDERNWWVVTDPKHDGFQVIVSLRTFAAGTTEKEMNEVLQTINLGYMLNAPSRLAMSHPGLQATDPKKLPKEALPEATKLEKLFKDYLPPKPG